MNLPRKIDVTIATKNSEETIEKCIKCIKKYVPYNNIIVIDDSEDKTPEIVKKMGAKVYAHYVLLGEKRYLQAKYSKTEWIASIDSDVFVDSNWWPELSNYIGKQNIVIIHGWVKENIENGFPFYGDFKKFFAVLTKRMNSHSSAMGGTLIKRSILLECKNILKNVNRGEDVVIGRYIQKSGYDYKLVEKITGEHFHKDPFKHIKFVNFYKGVTYVKRFGRIRGYLNLCIPFSGLPLLTVWLIYSLYKRKFDFKLLRFLIILLNEKRKGILSRIKNK